MIFPNRTLRTLSYQFIPALVLCACACLFIIEAVVAYLDIRFYDMDGISGPLPVLWYVATIVAFAGYLRLVLRSGQDMFAYLALGGFIVIATGIGANYYMMDHLPGFSMLNLSGMAASLWAGLFATLAAPITMLLQRTSR